MRERSARARPCGLCNDGEPACGARGGTVCTGRGTRDKSGAGTGKRTRGDVYGTAARTAGSRREERGGFFSREPCVRRERDTRGEHRQGAGAVQTRTSGTGRDGAITVPRMLLEKAQGAVRIWRRGGAEMKELICIVVSKGVLPACGREQ